MYEASASKRKVDLRGRGCMCQPRVIKHDPALDRRSLEAVGLYWDPTARSVALSCLASWPELNWPWPVIPTLALTARSPSRVKYLIAHQAFLLDDRRHSSCHITKPHLHIYHPRPDPINPFPIIDLIELVAMVRDSPPDCALRG